MPQRLTVLLALAAAAAFGGLLAGGSDLSLAQVAGALAHPHGSDAAIIVWQLRMPRVIIGALVGAALSISGAALQGLLRNPLVDPFLTGVSSGAAVAIVIGMALGISPALLPALGFASGLATASLVAALARRGSGIDPTRLILAGVSISSLGAAIIALLLTRLRAFEAGPAIVGWLAGSLAGRGWSDLLLALPYACIGGLAIAASIPALRAMRIGEARARSAGVNIARTQWLVLGGTAMLTACAVSLSGTVGFVGLIVPHVARRIVGSDSRVLFPASALAGAALTVLADAFCRTAFAPTEIPIGVVLAFIGVPAFLYLYLRSERSVLA